MHALGHRFGARAPDSRSRSPCPRSCARQDSLGHDNKALMLVQVAPEPSNAQESLCSLQFASRVRCVELGRAKTHGNNAEAMERLRDAAKQAKQAASEAGQRAEEAEQRAGRAEAEKEAAEARVKASSEAASEAVQRASEAEKKREEAVRSHKEMAALLSEAQEEMGRLRKEVATAKEEAEASRAEAERAKVERQAGSQSGAADLDKLRSALREVQEDRDTQVMVLEEQLEGMRTVHEDERSRLEEERDRLEKKLTDAEARLCAQSSAAGGSGSGSGEAEEEQASLREALKAEQRQRQGVEGQLECLRSSHKALEAELRRAQETAAQESKAARRARHAAEAAEAAVSRNGTPAPGGRASGSSGAGVPRCARKQVRWATPARGGDENIQDYANVGSSSGGGGGVLGAIPEESEDGYDNLWDDSDEDSERVASAPISGHTTPAAPRSVLKKTPRSGAPRPHSSAVAGSARQARHTQLPPARPRRGSSAHATPLKRGSHSASVKRTGLGCDARDFDPTQRAMPFTASRALTPRSPTAQHARTRPAQGNTRQQATVHRAEHAGGVEGKGPVKGGVALLVSAGRRWTPPRLALAAGQGRASRLPAVQTPAPLRAEPGGFAAPCRQGDSCLS